MRQIIKSEIMRPSLILMLTVAAGMALTSCDDTDCEKEPLSEAVETMTVDGGSDYYTISTASGGSWEITSIPEWITPVESSGDASDEIRIYVENNGGGVARSGEIAISYGNGSKKCVRLSQSSRTERFHLERAQGIGWGVDVTSYMDSRGLTDQIFNTEKIKAFDPDAIAYDVNRRGADLLFQGESMAEMKKDMEVKMNLNVKVNAFDGALSGAFDKSSMTSSKRYFAWQRALCQKKTVSLILDYSDAQEYNLFTHDFAKARQRVIDAGASDKSIRELIEHYGTHYIYDAGLGGYLDYFYSFVQTEETDKIDVTAALKFGFDSKFGIKADVDYSDALKKTESEKIEKFFVRGGDVITITNLVATGAVDANTVDNWKKSLSDETTYELVSFDMQCISALFPAGIDTKINDYINRIMYYEDLPLTRSSRK